MTESVFTRGRGSQSGAHTFTLVFESLVFSKDDSSDKRLGFWTSVAADTDSSSESEQRLSDSQIADYEQRVERELGDNLRRRVAGSMVHGYGASGPLSSSNDIPGFNIVARVRRYGSLEVALTVFGLSEAAKFVGNNVDTVLTLIELHAPEALNDVVLGQGWQHWPGPPGALPVSATLSGAAPRADTRQQQLARLLAGGGALVLPVLLALLIAYVWFAASHDELERARTMQREVAAQQQALASHDAEQLKQYRSLERALIERWLLSPRSETPGAGASSGSQATPGAAGSQPTPGAASSGTTVPAEITGGAVQGNVTARATTLVASIGGLVVLLGWVLWARAGDNKGAKAAAAAVATAGLVTVAGARLIGEIKIDSIFSIDKIPITINLSRELVSQLSTGPQFLGSIYGFKPGEEFLAEKAGQADVDKVTDAWRQSRGTGKTGTLLLVGSADRLPLRRRKLQRFDSNVGLARARAETVKVRLQDALKKYPAAVGIDDQRILVLVSGPQTTPDLPVSPLGHREDRKVEVWAIWGWEPPKGP